MACGQSTKLEAEKETTENFQQSGRGPEPRDSGNMETWEVRAGGVLQGSPGTG